MKKLLLTLIVSLAMCGSIFAQYESHWPDFYYPNFMLQTPCVAAIAIDGEIVTADNHPDNWNALEIAFFVGDECRGAGVAFGAYLPQVNYLYNGSVEEWGDPYPVIDGAPVYYDNPGEVVTVRMFDHVNGIEYNECTITLLGEEYVIHTGEDNVQGWDDPENPIILNFISSASDCKIVLNEENPTWSEDFEDEGEGITALWTGVLPDCWSYVMFTNAGMNEIGEQIDTMPQVYRSFNSTPGGHYSLRMHYRTLLAMPELAPSVDLANVRLNMYVRQSYWSYKLQIGVITDMENPDESFVPVAVVNNPDKNKTYVECSFWAAKDLVGEGRHIAFKNIGGSEGDLYCVNYLDDIVLSYVDCGITEEGLEYSENFEGDYENLPKATGVEPYCWDIIAEDAALESTTKPQIYRGFNGTEGGEYSLRMKNRCIYAMPELVGIDVVGLSMTLKVRQPNDHYRLQVGVVDDEGNFLLAKTIRCNSTSMEEFTVNFASLLNSITPTTAVTIGNRIAFRNTLVPGSGMDVDYYDYSYNYIDDINVFHTEAAKNSGNVENLTDAMNADLDNIEVYPNPTTGKLYIDAVDIQKVECYNQMGQLVRVYDNVTNTIELSNLADGVYMLRITVPQGVTMRKVVKR